MKLPAHKEEEVKLPLKIPFFRTDFSTVPTDKLYEYSAMLDAISYCVDTDSPATVDVWKVLSRLSCLLRCELYDRENKKRERSHERKKRQKRGECVAVPKKKVVRPVKAGNKSYLTVLRDEM